MNLHLNVIADFVPPEIPDDPNCAYESVRVDLISQLNEIHILQQTLDSTLKVISFLESNTLNTSVMSYIQDTFGIEEIIGIPLTSITPQNQEICSELCLEGFKTIILDIIAKIVAFFKKLYDTIVNFLGIKSFRFRKIEHDLHGIQQNITAMTDEDFQKKINRVIRCNTTTMRLKDMDNLIADCNEFYNLIGRSKDIAQLSGLITTTAGMLTKIGYKVKDEYKIENEAGLPYELLEENQPLNIHTSFGISSKHDVNTRIDQILKIQETILDLGKWYPVNLKKYAARATNIAVVPGDAEAEKLQKENIIALNEEQKCQAYLCKMIILYTNLVDLLCAKGIATFKSIESGKE